MGLQVVTGKRMLPSHDMNRHLCAKEEEGRGKKKKKKEIPGQQWCEKKKKDTTVQRSWVNSKSGKCKFWISGFANNSLNPVRK